MICHPQTALGAPLEPELVSVDLAQHQVALPCLVMFGFTVQAPAKQRTTVRPVTVSTQVARSVTRSVSTTA